MRCSTFARQITRSWSDTLRSTAGESRRTNELKREAICHAQSLITIIHQPGFLSRNLSIQETLRTRNTTRILHPVSRTRPSWQEAISLSVTASQSRNLIFHIGAQATRCLIPTLMGSLTCLKTQTSLECGHTIAPNQC